MLNQAAVNEFFAKEKPEYVFLAMIRKFHEAKASGEDVVYADVRKDGRKCRMEWDASKPNGTPRKLCDVTRLNALGWKAKVDVREGVKIAYDDFLNGEVRK